MELKHWLFCSSIDLFYVRKMEVPWWSSNIYFFARVSICLTSKISKEIWQIVIWSENVFKDRNLSREKFPGDEHLTSSSTKTA